MSRERRKKHRLRKLFFTIIFILAMLLLVWYLAVRALYGRMNYRESESGAAGPWQEEGVTNVLLIGSDAREGVEGDRSDAMILLSVNSKTGNIYMTSLLRDMYVEIPGHDGNRLNAAYSFGGPELLLKTVEQNLDIQVNRYVLVNFQAFSGLVDAAGGVDLEISPEEAEYINAYLVEYNLLMERAEGTDYLDTQRSGMTHLNGPQALAYSRIRYIGTDFGRTERQRKVLAAVMKELPAAIVTNPKKLADGLLPNLTTNLTSSECFLLSLQALRGITGELKQGSIPIEGSYQDAQIRGMAVLSVDFEQNKRWLKEEIYGAKE